MFLNSKSSISVAVISCALMVLFTLGSCNLDPELEVEGIGTEVVDGSVESNYSFPVYRLEDLNIAELQNSIVGVIKGELLIVIDPVLQSYKVYSLGMMHAEFVKVAPRGNKMVIVTSVSGASGNIQYRAVVWSLISKSIEFDEMFYGDVADVEWDIEGDNFLILGERNNSNEDLNRIYKGDNGTFRDVTSTYIEVPFGYELVSPGIYDIATSYGIYGSLYASLVTRRAGSSTLASRYYITRYELSNRFVSEVRYGSNLCYNLRASRNDDHIMFISQNEVFIMDPYYSVASQLSVSAVETSGLDTRYCFDNDGEYIYSVGHASLDIKKYDIAMDSHISIPLLMDEVFSLNNFQFVK